MITSGYLHMMWKQLRMAAIPVVVVGATISLGFLFHIRGERVVEAQLRERLLSTISIAALYFDGDQIQRVRNREDMASEDFRILVEKLKQLRKLSPHVRFAYIMRKTEDPMSLAFVADADALSAPDELDIDNSNAVEEDEEPGFTGDPYPIGDVEILQGPAFLTPVVDDEITSDQWGNFISAYAPIADSTGNVVAIIGMDMTADAFFAMTQSTFSVVAVALVGLLGVFLAAYILFIIRVRHLESLQQVDGERTALLDLATHQLGMPLATFKWWLELLRERDNGKFCKKDGVCEQLQQGIDRMDSIIKSLHEASDLQFDTARPSGQSQLLVVAKKVADDVSKFTRDRKQRVVFSFDKMVKNVAVDKKLLAGMIRELLENASFYSPEHTDIVVSAHKIFGGVEFSVQDHGHGIPRQDLPHIFEKFRRGANASKYKPVGNGLGLYIVHRIVEKAHGRIHIESTLNKGTIITILLPSA